MGFRFRFCGENSAVGIRQRALKTAFRRLDFGIGFYAAGFERWTFGGERLLSFVCGLSVTNFQRWVLAVGFGGWIC